MSEAQLIKPDLGYVKEVIAAGGESLKKCYQCATCTVVCDVTGDAQPFPRKEMVWAQWGLKDRLINDADVWLCHQCADCTAKCPRDAKPGEVLGAIRRTAYRAHAVPGFMGTLFSDIKYLPVVFADPDPRARGDGHAQQPAAGRLAPLPALRRRGLHARRAADQVLADDADHDRRRRDLPDGRLPRGPLGRSRASRASGATSRRRCRPPCRARASARARRSSSASSLSHASFKKCTVNAGRTLAHLLVFYGFIGAFIATNIVLVYEWGTKFGIFHELETPLAVLGPPGLLPKLFGNVGGLAIVLGALLMIGNRM